MISYKEFLKKYIKFYHLVTTSKADNKFHAYLVNAKEEHIKLEINEECYEKLNKYMKKSPHYWDVPGL